MQKDSPAGRVGGWVVELRCETASRENSEADSVTHEVDTWYSQHSHSTHLARNMPQHIEHIWCIAHNLLDAHSVAALLFELRETTVAASHMWTRNAAC